VKVLPQYKQIFSFSAVLRTSCYKAQALNQRLFGYTVRRPNGHYNVQHDVLGYFVRKRGSCWFVIKLTRQLFDCSVFDYLALRAIAVVQEIIVFVSMLI
jgi:hypothetical protein